MLRRGSDCWDVQQTACLVHYFFVDINVRFGLHDRLYRRAHEAAEEPIILAHRLRIGPDDGATPRPPFAAVEARLPRLAQPLPRISSGFLGPKNLRREGDEVLGAAHPATRWASQFPQSQFRSSFRKRCRARSLRLLSSSSALISHQLLGLTFGWLPVRTSPAKYRPTARLS